MLSDDGFAAGQSYQDTAVESATHGKEVESSLPHKARLVSLKTRLEAQNRESVIDVFVTTVPVKAAHETLNILRQLLDGVPNAPDLQHLRRYAKSKDLPGHVRALILPSTPMSHGANSQDLHLLIGLTESTDLALVKLRLGSHLGVELDVKTVQVPLLAPTSPEQALRWSAQYWPTVYRKSNPFGPHPSIVARAEEEIADAAEWMKLARAVAARSKASGCGEAVGAVVVDRQARMPRVVALAGDARWESCSGGASGNVTAHAVMRAIGMVGRQVCASETNTGPFSELHAVPEAFLDTPLHDSEAGPFEDSVLPTHGYLCHNLEVFVTHEPCIMCSMAIVHSRFSKVIFGQRMPKTGGLSCELSQGESSLNHGLFWRKELNWCLLAWQWTDDQLSGVRKSPTFHA